MEGELEELAWRDGYLPALRERCDPQVVVLREDAIATRDVAAVTMPDAVAERAPRIEVLGSAAAATHDLLATWGVMHFDADWGRRFAFLRVWQLETARWQVAADVVLALPGGR